MDNDVKHTGRSGTRRRFCAAAVLLAGMLSAGGCVTHPPVADVFPHHLDQIRPGARVTVLTRDGQSIDMNVTAVASDRVSGIDRRFRTYEIPIDDITELTVASQNDTIVMLTWVAVIFATGL